MMSESNHTIEATLHTPSLSPDKETRKELESLAWDSLAPPFDTRDVVLPMYTLAESLSPYLTSYDLVVADDTSGRLPALVLWRLINRARAEGDLPKASLRFYVGRYPANSNITPSTFVTPAHNEESRALVVTESIVTGQRAINVYNTVANSRGKDNVDLATVGLDNSQLNPHASKLSHLTSMGSGSHLFYGTTNRSKTDRKLHHGGGPYKGVVKGIARGNAPFADTLASQTDYDDTSRKMYRPAIEASRSSSIKLANTLFEALRRKKRIAEPDISSKALKASQHLLSSGG